MDDVVVYANGLAYCSVCTALTDPGEVARRVNVVNPTGVMPWAVADEAFRTGESNPHACEDDAARQHFLLVC